MRKIVLAVLMSLAVIGCAHVEPKIPDGNKPIPEPYATDLRHIRDLYDQIVLLQVDKHRGSKVDEQKTKDLQALYTQRVQDFQATLPKFLPPGYVVDMDTISMKPSGDVLPIKPTTPTTPPPAEPPKPSKK